jgi:AAA+ superfamily predicted ATPase
MQELEQANPNGLFVATSNLPRVLDKALRRRFDVELEFPLPNKTELGAFAKKKAKHFEIAINAPTRKKLTTRLSYADVEKLIIALARRSALKGL